MKMLSFALTLLASQAALALGPIPNGEYLGSTTCQSAGEEPFNVFSKVVVGDRTLTNVLEGEPHEKVFEMVDRTNFIVRAGSDIGFGQFTSDGVNFEISINGVKGEDRYRYLDGIVYLTGSADIQGLRYLCYGFFKPE